MEGEIGGPFTGGLRSIGIPIVIQIEQLFDSCSRLLIGFSSFASAQFAGKIEPILFVWRGSAYVRDIMNHLGFTVARITRDKYPFPSQLGIHLAKLPLIDFDSK